MTSRAPIGLRASALAVVLVLVGAAARPAEVFVTSNGVRITTPPVAQLSCAALKAKLDQIDASGYRGLQPTPPDPRDMPLFEYESKVSNALYGDCQTDEMGPVERSEVFREGFRN